MKGQFINDELIHSLWLCSVFTGFVATGITLNFRQRSFEHAANFKQMETDYYALQSETLALSAKIAQMQAPHNLMQQLPTGFETPKQIYRVAHWGEYKDSVTRSAVAANTQELPLRL